METYKTKDKIQEVYAKARILVQEFGHTVICDASLHIGDKAVERDPYRRKTDRIPFDRPDWEVDKI